MNNLTKTDFKNNFITQETEWLEAEDFNQASLISATVTPEKYQWQTYLNSLALSAFKRWFNGRIDDNSIIINEQECSLFKPTYIEILPHVTNLQIGNFKYCLIVTESLASNTFKLAKAVCDLPQFVPHFYILIQVLPEEEEIIIHGGFNYDQLLEYKQNNPLKLDDDYTYTVESKILKFKGDRCIYYTQFLNPETIKLPVAESNFKLASNFNLSLEEIKHQLLEIKTTVVNTAKWLQNQANNVIDNWIVFPYSFELRENFRSNNIVRDPYTPKEFQGIMNDLHQKKIIEIPDTTASAYREINLSNLLLRIYAFMWLIPSSNEWGLIVILRPQTGIKLPDGITLSVRDENELIDEVTLEKANENAYLYIPVIGELNEQFFVTVSLITGESLTLESLTYARQ
jgi:hypothetical protein